MRSPEFDSTDLARLQTQLRAWRKRQSGRPRLPERFWRSAGALARIHGVSRVSRALGIGYHKLNRLAAKDPVGNSTGSKRHSPAGVGPFPFVEVALPTPFPSLKGPASHAGLVEFCDASERKLRIEIPTDPDLCLRLMEAFWRLAL
jgi:hypothetical protein